MRVLAVDTGHGPAETDHLAAVGEWLAAAGAEVEHRTLPRRPLPRGDREAARLDGMLAATPAPLVASWRAARHVEAMTGPGDVVLLSDAAGVAGVFALEQAMRPPGARRRVLVAAGLGTGLAMLAMAGTLEGVGEPEVFEIDWEMAAYRFADAVLTPSPQAARLVRGLGGAATVAAVAEEPVTVPGSPTEAVYLPEPACRLSRTGEILRALQPGRPVRVSAEDCDDRVWTGTTWEALAGVRARLGDGVARGGPPAGAAWVLGDPYALPSRDAARHRRRGGQVIVAAESAAAARWPGTPVWAGEDSLAAALADPAAAPGSPPPPAPALALGEWPADPDRARRVSVGVPVYRDVDYLDECLESVLGQTQPPHEVLVIDDGSASPHVDEALAAWERRSELVRVLRQSNRGVCVARNRMLEAMTGDAFVLVDADDVLRPEFVEKCATALQSNPELAAVATWTEFFGAYEGVEAKPPFDARVGRRENPIVSTCVMVDMAVRDQGVRFAPDLAFLFCEDWDVWSQIVAAGGKFGLVPEPLARHRVHRSSGGFQRTALAASLGKARATARLRG